MPTTDLVSQNLVSAHTNSQPVRMSQIAGTVRHLPATPWIGCLLPRAADNAVFRSCRQGSVPALPTPTRRPRNAPVTRRSEATTCRTARRLRRGRPGSTAAVSSSSMLRVWRIDRQAGWLALIPTRGQHPRLDESEHDRRLRLRNTAQAEIRVLPRPQATRRVIRDDRGRPLPLLA